MQVITQNLLTSEINHLHLQCHKMRKFLKFDKSESHMMQRKRYWSDLHQLLQSDKFCG